jgi:hypothetical protein
MVIVRSGWEAVQAKQRVTDASAMVENGQTAVVKVFAQSVPFIKGHLYSAEPQGRQRRSKMIRVQ